MPSIDVILEDPTITVLGGPSNIEVQLDTGATGQRGTQTYIGAGMPSSSTIPNYSLILPGDLYINSSPGVNYSWLYQYVVKPAGNQFFNLIHHFIMRYTKWHSLLEKHQFLFQFQILQRLLQFLHQQILP